MLVCYLQDLGSCDSVSFPLPSSSSSLPSSISSSVTAIRKPNEDDNNNDTNMNSDSLLQQTLGKCGLAGYTVPICIHIR